MDTFENGNRLAALLTKQYRIHIEKACFATDSIPNYILLDSTRNIHSYLEFCVLTNNSLESVHWNTNNLFSGIISVIQTQYSKLDRPLFFIYQNESSEIMGIESTPIREYILENGESGLYNFIIANSDTFSDLLLKIKNEL